MATVIAHCFNESYLMPWWIAHHQQVFDHGIIIDYNSTDRTRDIIREMAPTWEVRQSRNEFFDARLLDEEVMDIEKSVDGWKCTLNITEFLCCRDVQAFIWALEASDVKAAAIRAVLMADPEGHSYPEPTYDLPLVAQRFHGVFEDEFYDHAGFVQRSRIFHRLPCGDYYPGRHLVACDRLMHPPGALILWFGWSPWNEQAMARRKQIGPKVSPVDRIALRSHHLWDDGALLWNYRFAASHVEDMRLRADYRRIFSPWPFAAPLAETDRSALDRFSVSGVRIQRESITIGGKVIK